MMKGKSGKMVFAVPEGMKMPEGKGVGDEFEAPATFRLEAGGKLCLVSVGGLKVSGYDDESPEEEMADGEDEFMMGLEKEYVAQKGGKMMG